ncbi:hypothetical protein [uncultured Pleomorphomonas sp.]|nr:hypothetical protein [uncultured Pleomorphomonas sp.]
MLDPLLRASLRHDIVEVLAASDNVTGQVGELADRLTAAVEKLWTDVSSANLRKLDPGRLLAEVANHIDASITARAACRAAKEAPFLAAIDTEGGA